MGKTNTKHILSTNAASLFSDFDIELFKGGMHYRLYEKIGAQPVTKGNTQGILFSVWAPNASAVSVAGNFNGWDKNSLPMHARWDSSGIWELFIPDLVPGTPYKFIIRNGDFEAEKSDPFAFHCEVPPRTASLIPAADTFRWTDKKWMQERHLKQNEHAPLSIYEVHLGSWKRKDGNKFLSYRDMTGELPAYCREMGFTHVELMPVMEHPFYGSWGYQQTGYFAPDSRFGTPEDFMHLINELHKAGIGVILDWVPSHFPTDAHGLQYFDGTHLYEHSDPRKGFHPDWQSSIFNLGRNEVRAFLISNALYWLDRFHIDGLRVDAVASMLYLDYSRKEGEWIPNEFGGRENLESVEFFRQLNDAVHASYPDVLTIAEESTAWPGVTQPSSAGGLGFDRKWMMGWMHDTLLYFAQDPVYRSYHQELLTFSIIYTYSEKFILPFSHDEVVHGKHSLLRKMPGDEWQQFANLRLLFGYMAAHPGGKLLFMGDEFGQAGEWRHDYSLDWHEASGDKNKGVQQLIKDLNHLGNHPALSDSYNPAGFEWIDFSDRDNCVISWLRKGTNGSFLVCIFNFTPVVRRNYRLGMPEAGYYTELLNTDAAVYGGSDVHNTQLETAPLARHGRTHSLSLTLPPLATLVLEYKGPNF
ncbi:MAG: 1,4-alpha-glucan branching protein GlgB [Chitinophagaceae bacterium]